MGALGFADYPGLDPLEQGISPNRGYGGLQGIRCHAIEAGVSVTLGADMSVDDTTLTVTDSQRLLDNGGGENPFALQAGQEQLWVTSITDNTLSVTRGYGGTKPSVHPAGMRLYEVCSRYVYLLAAHPIKSVGSIYIDGRRQAQDGYNAYTGQSGDELAGYEGKAVVSLSAKAYVGRQFNLDSDSISSGIDVPVRSIAWSSSEVVDGMGGTFALAGGLSGVGPTAWAGFAPTFGTVLGRSYSADIENTAASSVAVRLVVRREGLLISSRDFTVAAETREALSIWLATGQQDDELAVIPLGGQIKVYGITKTLTVPDAQQRESYMEMLPAWPKSARTRALSVTGPVAHHAHYNASNLGQVMGERHEVSVTESSGTSPARLRLSAGRLGFKEVTIAAGATETVLLDIEGGAWSTSTFVGALSGEFSLAQLRKTVTYYPDSAGVTHESAETCSSRLVVGGQLRADAEMAFDSDGSYGGMGVLIQSPEHVMEHFLVSSMGFSSADIDAASFSAAGTAFAAAISGGYKFSFLIDHAQVMSRTLRRMAAESRSAVSYRQGKWRLDALPDTAPSAIRTIASDELAGKGAMFTFERAPLVDMANTLAVRYGLAQQGGWLGEYAVSDAPGLAKYGVYKKEVDLMLVCHKETARSVADHMLRQSAQPLMSVKFTVFYEHFDLGVGDTIEIENDLYSGSKFYIERIHRLDRFRAEVEALAWW